MELLPCVRSLNLSNNGITDEFDREILALFEMAKIKAIDLSFNNLKALGLQIGKKLRDEIVHITWLDMTMNDFFFQVTSLLLDINDDINNQLLRYERFLGTN